MFYCCLKRLVFFVNCIWNIYEVWGLKRKFSLIGDNLFLLLLCFCVCKFWFLLIIENYKLVKMLDKNWNRCGFIYWFNYKMGKWEC